jgi:tyrosyl-tRNA synthetase
MSEFNKSTNVFDTLMERGFIEQVTHEDEVRELLGKGPVTFYIGFDPTADSLHVGHFIQIMVMMHMQRAGHVPIALLGGGTAMIGDPSGKTDMRRMMTVEIIEDNLRAMKSQMDKYLVLDGEKGIFVNNGDWLRNLNYLEFLREVGSKFSVNRMLSAECFKQRMEKGLTFLEFNYMIMQGYDFLELNRRYNCKLELGGNDQWSNILAGTELIRRSERGDAYGLTFKLLTTSEGKKMGKTEAGALWINPDKTSPYEFFQYFRNVDDADVMNCIRLLTFIPMDTVREMDKWEGAELNKAKEILAFEITKIVHGEEEATKALSAAKALFSGGGDDSSMPSTELEPSEFGDEMNIVDLVIRVGLASSKGEIKRLIEQKGIHVNDKLVESFAHNVKADEFEDGFIKIRKGKKVFHKVVLK